MQNITITLKEITDKNGKKFTAFESFDKDNNRISIRFTENCKPAQPKENCEIEIIDGWVDKRKKYPIVRIREYKLIATAKIDIERSKKELSDLFKK